MQPIIILGVIVIFISYFARYKHAEFTLQLSFLIIFLFTALRYNYGTDYLGYYRIFNSVHSFLGIFSSYSYSSPLYIEKGWLILCYIFKPIGFFGMIFFLSAFICYTYYSLIKKYVHVNYYWLAVLIYVFSFDIMLIQFSAIRQALAIAILLNSIKYLYEKRSPLIYILLNIIAGTIHASGYFMLVFVIFAFEKVQKSNDLGYTIIIIFFGILFWGKYLLSLLSMLANIFVGDRYTKRFASELSSTPSLIGGLFWSLLLIIVLYFAHYQSQNYKYLFYFYALYFMTYVMSNLIFLADRLGYYFAPFCIIVLPQIALKEKDKILKIGLISLFLLLIFYRFYNFFTYDFVIKGYSKYQTVFSQW